MHDILSTPFNDLPEANGMSPEAFLRVLETWVAQLMAHHPDRLRQILYRMDVAESDAGLAALGPEPAKHLARLIWQREQQKAASQGKSTANALHFDAYAFS